MKTLVIHPKDWSTDFLKPIYKDIPDYTLIDGEPKMDIREVNKLIETHERVIMLGHGCPYGLFSLGKFPNSCGLVINPDTVPLLREKTENVYIWCHANMYVEKFKLKGFYSGMFISEVGEAWGEGFRNSYQDEIDKSNDGFSLLLGKHINESVSDIHKNVTKDYGEINCISLWNNERLKVL